MQEYVTIYAPAEDEFVERKSRFIGAIAPVQTEEEAQAWIAQVRQQHQNADKRREAGRKRRAEHAQSARENENVIEHDVEQAACDHAAHGNGRRTVVARER